MHARRGYWGREFYLQIDPEDRARMKGGVVYALHARNVGVGPKWKVAPGVTISR